MKLLDGNIKPLWNLEDFTTLEYKKDTIKTSYQLKEFSDAGHNLNNMIIYNYFEPNPMPAGVDIVKTLFEKQFNHVTIAVNLFKPGTYVPYHNDLYQKYKSVNSITDKHDIYRFIVMLEKGEQGQMLQIGKTVHYLWKAGDYFGWKNDEVHASYNMSIRNRYALQVTASK